LACATTVEGWSDNFKCIWVKDAVNWACTAFLYQAFFVATTVLSWPQDFTSASLESVDIAVSPGGPGVGWLAVNNTVTVYRGIFAFKTVVQWGNANVTSEELLSSQRSLGVANTSVPVRQFTVDWAVFGDLQGASLSVLWWVEVASHTEALAGGGVAFTKFVWSEDVSAGTAGFIVFGGTAWATVVVALLKDFTMLYASLVVEVA